ncbi:hypothetical protein ACLQ3H_16390 [Micromonospora saelicesensis]
MATLALLVAALVLLCVPSMSKAAVAPGWVATARSSSGRAS